MSKKNMVFWFCGQHVKRNKILFFYLALQYHITVIYYLIQLIDVCYKSKSAVKYGRE